MPYVTNLSHIKAAWLGAGGDFAAGSHVNRRACSCSPAVVGAGDQTSIKSAWYVTYRMLIYVVLFPGML